MAPRRPFATIRRLVRARDVFGKPVHSDGVTVIPVASVLGGGGGGHNEGPTPAGTDGAKAGQANAGLGFGLAARPVGAFVIRDGKVGWRPAVDVTSLLIAATISGAVVARWMLRNR